MVGQTKTGEHGQDTLPRGTRQRLRSRYAPWIVLAAWAFVNLTLAVFYRMWERGPGPTLAGLTAYLAFGASAVGLSGWATFWLMLSSDSFGARVLHFSIAICALLLTMYIGSPNEMRELIPDFAKLVVGVATTLILMRRWGWRIAIKEPSSQEYGDAYVRGETFQFWPIDLVALTTGIGIFVGLLIADGSNGVSDDFVVTCLFVATVFFTSAVTYLLAPKILLTGVLVAVICVAVSLLTLSGHSPILVLICGACTCLFLATSALRFYGYRLARY